MACFTQPSLAVRVANRVLLLLLLAVLGLLGRALIYNFAERNLWTP